MEKSTTWLVNQVIDESIENVKIWTFLAKTVLTDLTMTVFLLVISSSKILSRTLKQLSVANLQRRRDMGTFAARGDKLSA